MVTKSGRFVKILRFLLLNVSAVSVELKVGTPIRDYRLSVVTGGAEPQEGGGIARTWIEDLKVYPGIPMPQ